MGEDDASVQLHENRVMLSEYEQNLLKAREELSSRLVNLDQDVAPPLPHNHNNRRKQSQITGILLLRYDVLTSKTCMLFAVLFFRF